MARDDPQCVGLVPMHRILVAQATVVGVGIRDHIRGEQVILNCGHHWRPSWCCSLRRRRPATLTDAANGTRHPVGTARARFLALASCLRRHAAPDFDPIASTAHDRPLSNGYELSNATHRNLPCQTTGPDAIGANLPYGPARCFHPASCHRLWRLDHRRRVQPGAEAIALRTVRRSTDAGISPVLWPRIRNRSRVG